MTPVGGSLGKAWLVTTLALVSFDRRYPEADTEGSNAFAWMIVYYKVLKVTDTVVLSEYFLTGHRRRLVGKN